MKPPKGLQSQSLVSLPNEWLLPLGQTPARVMGAPKPGLQGTEVGSSYMTRIEGTKPAPQSLLPPGECPAALFTFAREQGVTSPSPPPHLP